MSTPGVPDGGELSKVTLTGPLSEAACPLRPSRSPEGLVVDRVDLHHRPGREPLGELVAPRRQRRVVLEAAGQRRRQRDDDVAALEALARPGRRPGRRRRPARSGAPGCRGAPGRRAARPSSRRSGSSRRRSGPAARRGRRRAASRGRCRSGCRTARAAATGRSTRRRRPPRRRPGSTPGRWACAGCGGSRSRRSARRGPRRAGCFHGSVRLTRPARRLEAREPLREVGERERPEPRDRPTCGFIRDCRPPRSTSSSPSSL